MKNRGVTAAALLIMAVLTACSSSPAAQSGAPDPASAAEQGQIYLYGEAHGQRDLLDQELELWRSYYLDEGMRHLFVELPYYTAEFLNLWMRADGDDILDALYADWDGTLLHTPDVKDFYSAIKSDCPETVFHGTDVGHQHDTTGQRFLNYLKDNGLGESEAYQLAREAVEQGRYFREHQDDVYRENTMAKNFIREYDKLNGASAMGIYGSAHTDSEAMDFVTGTVPCMAKQLREVYGDTLRTETLSFSRTDTISAGGKEYQALYLGKYNRSGIQGYLCREFWRLKDAYGDFSAKPLTGDVLPFDNYPAEVETGQVFVIDYTKTDGSVERKYYRADGREWQGRPITEQFLLE